MIGAIVVIRTLAVTKDKKIIPDLSLEQLSTTEIDWYWVDFENPNEEETIVLDTHFHFHPLAIEDCLHFLQRPKLDYYEGHTFFVLHAINQRTLNAEEVDMFAGRNYVVTFHYAKLEEIDTIWERFLQNQDAWSQGPSYLVYTIMDKLVDYYFPCLYKLEDHLHELENNTKNLSTSKLIEEVFDIRGDLLKLRKTVVPMRDLLYRIVNSDHLEEYKVQRVYFTDIYDHLLKLAEMIESNREITSDMRDSYLSLNSNRMNSIMMTLTIITTIFIPLTFITSIYGMNFEYMPELKWRYGYFMVLGVIAILAFGMIQWFKRKGWFKRM
jgi:magnesium transporter